MKDRLIRIGRAVQGYYRQLDNAKPTDKDFKLWIESLEEPMRSSFKAKGLKGCKDVLNFQRFILRLQDKRLGDYLKTNLKEEDYKFWLEQQ